MIDQGAALGPWYGGGVVHGAPFVFPFCSPSVCQVFTFCLPSVHLLFAKCSPSVCQVFTFCLPPPLKPIAIARDRHATDVYTSRPKGFPFATLRLYESMLTRCACRPWI